MKVKSSNISDIDYDEKTKLLTITFKSGGVYAYHEVSPKNHAALMSADSHGEHLSKHIKGVHKHTKVEKEDK